MNRVFLILSIIYISSYSFLGQTKVVFNVLETKPFISCPNDTGLIIGYEYDFMMAALINTSLSKDSIQFSCIQRPLNIDELFTNMKNNETQTAAFGGLVITSDYSSQFSFPVMKGGMSIVTYLDDNSFLYSIFEPFTWSLWIGGFGVIIIIGILYFMYESNMRDKIEHNLAPIERLLLFNFYTFELIFGLIERPIRTFYGGILILGYLMFSAVAANYYLAYQISKVEAQISFLNSPEQLSGKKIIIEDTLVDMVIKYNPSLYQTSADLLENSKIKYLLEHNKANAYITTTPKAEMFVRNDCNFNVGLNSFGQFNYGVAFSENFNVTVRREIEDNIRRLKLNITFNKYLRDVYFTKILECKDKQSKDLVTFSTKDFAGLWYLLIILISSLFLMRCFPLKMMRPQSNKEFKLKNAKSIKERFEEKTTKLLNMTNKLMERNESNFLMSVDNLKESVNNTNAKCNDVIESLDPLGEKVAQLKDRHIL